MPIVVGVVLMQKKFSVEEMELGLKLIGLMEEVGSEIMQAAIQLTKFYIGQVKLIHANSCASKDNLPATYFKIINLSKRKGWLKAKDVQNGIRDFRKEQPNQIRSI